VGWSAAECPLILVGNFRLAIMITACKELGAKNAELVKYMTSGDVTGDYGQVVGYGGIIVK